MINKHAPLFSILISVILLITGALFYPGGSQYDKYSHGFDWKNNYLCNLFNETAINGLPNDAMPWAIVGMLALCIGFSMFFIRFSTKIPSPSSARAIRFFGPSGMLFAFLVNTSYHDLMTSVASVISLIPLTYITFLVLK